MKIGIVGQGYVGTAIKTVFEKHYKTNTFDLNGKCNCKTLDELVELSDIIFVCVPTPMNTDGSCNIDIVESVVTGINDVAGTLHKSDLIVAIKSTVPPGTTNVLDLNNEFISVIFNPEFLTEANFIEDFKNQDRIIIGGKMPSQVKASSKLRQVYSLAFPNAKIVKTGAITAEMVKYMINTFLATKVSFANEIKMICDKVGIDYDKVVEYSTYDKRLGESHWAVPGPDGKNGFGGSCFPKDINALIFLARELEISPNVLASVWSTNLDVRPEQDWKELKGRAVVDEKK